jgi:hypothetical protein
MFSYRLFFISQSPGLSTIFSGSSHLQGLPFFPLIVWSSLLYEALKSFPIPIERVTVTRGVLGKPGRNARDVRRPYHGNDLLAPPPR